MQCVNLVEVYRLVGILKMFVVSMCITRLKRDGKRRQRRCLSQRRCYGPLNREFVSYQQFFKALLVGEQKKVPQGTRLM